MIGAQLAIAICRRTRLLRWALPARKLCLERMHSVVQGMLPLALTAPLAALRLNALQSRRAHVILMGRASYTDENAHKITNKSHQGRPGMDANVDNCGGAFHHAIPENEE